MLGVRRLRESHTADYIAAEINELLQKLNIPNSKIVGVCTDRGADMLAAVRKLLGEGKNIYCFAHLLNLIVQDGLEDINNEILKNLISEIKNLVTFARKSNVNVMEKLRAEQEREGTVEGKIIPLVQAVPTKWNSTYLMLKRFVKLAPLIVQILTNPSIKNAPRMVSGADIQLVSEVLNIFMPFDEATKEISGSDYITGSLVISLLTIIETTLKNNNSKHNAAKILCQKLSSLQEKGVKVLQNPLLCHASLSDPRFKKFYMNPLIATKAITNFSQEVRQYLSEIGKLSPLPQIDEATTENLLWSRHDQVVASTCPVELESSFPHELWLYLQQPLVPRCSDPFVFWEQSKTCMPGLSFIAQKYLCLVGSSVASERLVSTLNDIVSDERTRLTDQHIVERVFLNRLENKYWPLG
nr:zinc finger BED domain-containing protein 4-like [Onthophagus taurus]